MNRKGQAALEYLMTYGWALIVIAIVVGVLVFIVSSPAGPQCQSSDPAKIVFQTQNLRKDLEASSRIKLQNITGGNIIIDEVTADEAEFSSAGALLMSGGVTENASGDSIGLTVTAGNSVEIQPDYVIDDDSTLADAIYTIYYTDSFQLDKTVTISCNGSLPV